MRSETKTIRCNSCEKEFSARVILQIDCAKAADRKIDLSEGEPFLFTCPHCGAKMHLNHFLLWVDEQHTVALCNLADEGELSAVEEALSALVSFGKAASIRRRYLSSPAQLWEKISIFEAGLDDRTVEIVKLYMAEEVRRAYPQKTLTDVLFVCKDGVFGFLFRCPDGDLTVELSKEKLDAVGAKFAFSEPSPQRVDAAWALQFLTGGKSC
jgi:hypothetical protein